MTATRPLFPIQHPTIFQAMAEYQSVVVRLTGRSREDEESVTDILNERDRMGWIFHSSTSLAQGKLLLIFTRET